VTETEWERLRREWLACVVPDDWPQTHENWRQWYLTGLCNFEERVTMEGPVAEEAGATTDD
jgi:hypothetical protein